MKDIIILSLSHSYLENIPQSPSVGTFLSLVQMLEDLTFDTCWIKKMHANNHNCTSWRFSLASIHLFRKISQLYKITIKRYFHKSLKYLYVIFIRCWMSIFNPLIWVFFAPAIIFFVVCSSATFNLVILQ